MLSASPNSRVIDVTSTLHPYWGCTDSVSESTLAGKGFLADSGLRPVVELDNVQCCDCSANCVLDGCQVIGREGTNCCGILGDPVDLDDFEGFEPCLLGPVAGMIPGCECYDLVLDDSLDLRDFAKFQLLFLSP